MRGKNEQEIHKEMEGKGHRVTERKKVCWQQLTDEGGTVRRQSCQTRAAERERERRVVSETTLLSRTFR